MSDFKIKVTADLDASQVEAKIKALEERFKNYSIKTNVNLNGNGVNNLNSRLQQIQDNANGIARSFRGIAATKIKVDALNFLKNQTESAIQSVTDLNKAMTLVSMTMSNMSSSSLNSLKEQSLSLAKDLSTYTKTVTDAVTIYANENESAASMLAKAQPTVLLSAASGMSASSSADAIQGIMNQFNLSEDQAMHIADVTEKLSSEIALDFSKGCDTISQSIATSGSVVNEAGMSFEKYAALVSTTAEKTRQSGSQIGNAFKTIFSRISRSKDGLTTDAEMSKAEEAFKSVGVSVRGADGDLRDVSDTLDDLNQVWGTLNHSQKSYVAEQAAGVKQKNIFEAAMDSYSKALQLEQDALNSDGTAMKINEKRADSINGRIEKLSATMTKLYSDAMPEEAVNGMLDLATAVAKVVDNFGLFQGALSSLGVVGGAKIISTIASNWTGLLSAITSPVGIGSIVTGGAVAAISAYRQSVQEMMESAKQAGSEWESGQEGIQGQIDKVTELRTALDSGTLSEQEAASAKSELLSIQESLTESYGSQVAGIDLINGSLTEQIDLLDKVSQKQAEQFQNENKKGIDKATKEVEKKRHTYAGRFYDDGSDEAEAIKASVKKLQDTYGDEVVKLDKSADGITTDIHINADASQAIEVFNDFMNEISDVQKTYGESDMTNLMLDNASVGLTSAKDVLDEYQDLYNQAQKAKLVAEDDLYKAPSGEEQTAVKWLNDYANAVEKYNDALSNDDTDAIKEASTEFDAVDNAVQSLLKNSDMSEFADQFTEVRDQLNESAISANKFNEALSGNDSSKFGKEVKKNADALKELNLTDTDFKYAFETDGIQEGEDQINSLVNSAMECGLISDTSTEQVSKLVNVLSSLGIISSSTGEAVDTTTQAVSDLTEQIDNAQTVLTGIEKANSILNSQSTGKSISIDNYNSDELADYTSALEYSNDALQLNAEKVRELQKAKAEEAIQTNDNQKLEKQNQYMENIAQIEQLQEELRGLSDAKSENAQAIQESINALLSENDGIVNQCNQLDLLSASLREATGAYQNWLDKQNGSESGDMFDDAMGALTHIEDVTQNTDSEDYGRIGTNSYKAAVDFIIPDTIDHNDEAAVSSYIDSVEHYFNHDSDGNRTGLDVAEFCAKATKAGLMELDEASDEYKIAGQRTMQDFADGLNLSLPMVQSMFGEMGEFGAEFDWADEAIKTLGDLGMAAGEAKGRIEELKGNENLDIQIDVSDIENTEDKIATLDNTIAQMQQYKTTLDVDSSQVDDANTVIQYCVTQKQMLETPAVMNVDTSKVNGELSNALSLLQQFQNAQNNVELQTAIKADTSEAQGKVDGLVSEIQGLSPEIQAKLNIDTTSADTITASLQGLTPEIMVKAGVDSSVVDAYAAEEKKSDGIVKWENNTGAVDAWAAQMHTSNGQVTWTNDISQVKTTFTATGTVNWTNTTPPTGGTHGVNGTAHASGTAHYNHLVGHAYANGNWGTKTGGTTLVGELGREIVVDPGSGTWHTVGDNGAEFVNIPAGSIVFNHLQSEALLERGFVNGRGTARANGTAMVRGGISKKQANIASHKTTYAGSHSSSPSSTTPANTSAQKANTKATNDNTKATKKNTSAFDYVAQRLSYFANKTKAIADKITDYVSSAFKTSQLKRQINAISSEINVNTRAAQAYLDKANSVGLTYNQRKTVQEGSYSIVDYETSSSGNTKTLYDKLNDYKKYYDEYVKCTQAVQELKNQQLELFEQWANMPIEEAEKKIERLKNGFKGLTAIQARLNVANLGGSAQSFLKQQMTNTLKPYTTIINNRKNAQTKYNTAVKTQKSAQSQANKDAKTLKTATSKLKNNKSVSLNRNERNRINSGLSLSTKGLKGTKKKLVEQYNSALKKNTTSQNKLASAKSATTRAKNTLATANSNYNKIKPIYSVYSSQYKELTKYMKSGDSLSYQNSLVDAELANTKSQNAVNQTAYKQAVQNRLNIQKQADAVNPTKIRENAKTKAKKTGSSILKKYSKKLTKSQRNSLKNGTKVNTKGIKNKKLLKQLNAYNKALDNASKKAKNSQEKYNQLSQQLTIAKNKEMEIAATAAESQAEYAQKAIEAEQTKFDNVSQYYNTKIDYEKSLADKSEKVRELDSAKGNYTKSSDYNAQISDMQKQQQLQSELAEKLQKQLDKSVKTGKIKKGSDEWLKMRTEIVEAESAVADYNTQIENLKQQQLTTKYEEMFDRAIDKADKFISKLNSIDDLISDDMKYDYETGELTEFGALSIALNAKELDSQIANIKQYAQKRKQIKDDFANGKYGEQKYDELMAENDSSMQSAIKNASNYRDAIVKIITSQAQAVQDALFKVMDARKKALQKKKEYYDYDKQLKNKTSEIQLLDQQIAALDGLTDAESKAMKAKLEAQRKEKQEDLDDTVRDHVYDLQIDGLDDLKDQLSEDFEKWSKELASNLDKTTEVINKAVNSVGNNTAQVMDALAQVLKAYGVEPSDVLTNSDLKKLDGYASGTKRVGGVPRLAMTNEKGREILVTKKGILTPVLPTDGVVPSDMTSTLMSMAVDYQNFRMPEIKMPEIELVSKKDNEGGNVYNTHYDTLLTVQGDVTKDSLPDLKTILKQASEYTQNDIRKNRRRFG